MSFKASSSSERAMKINFVLLLVCGFGIQQGIAFQCFECDSTNAGACGDPFDGDNFNQKCNDESDGVVCVKREVEDNGILITARECQIRNTDYCENLQGVLDKTSSGTVIHCSYCDDNHLCNVGPKAVAASSMLAMFAASIHFILAN